MKLDTPTISAIEFSAIAFDLDGVLIDTEPVFAEAVRRYLGRRGIPYDAEFMHTMMGTPAAQSLPRFREQYRLPDPVAVIADETKNLFFNVLGAGPGPLMPGVAAFLGTLEERRIPFCIATSSGPEFVRRVFGPHGLLDRFQFILTCDDVARGKPFPDVYRLAARRFDITPESLLVFEDSPNGLRAAKAAKASCVVVPHAATPRHLLHGADAIVPSLESRELSEMLGLSTTPQTRTRSNT